MRLVADTNASKKVRTPKPLTTISEIDLSSLDRALELARNDRAEEVRNAATRLEAKLPSANSVGRLAVTLQNGTLGEQQTCSGDPGQDSRCFSR